MDKSPGSSPQVRGIYGGVIAEMQRLRIIPAGAGHLGAAKGAITSIGDHPRRCGAFYLLTAFDGVINGSSPQVRGICVALAHTPKTLGIIPAGAGHFGSVSFRGFTSGDHPRRCGAFPIWHRPMYPSEGSSPQVRGIFSRDFSQVFYPGIIPAGAGHLANPHRAPICARDHPRRCGAFTR